MCTYMILLTYFTGDGSTIGEWAANWRKVNSHSFSTDPCTPPNTLSVSDTHVSAHTLKIKDYGFRAFDAIDDTTCVEIFAAMDTNGSGTVSYAEWCKYLKTAETESKSRLGSLLSVRMRLDHHHNHGDRQS